MQPIRSTKLMGMLETENQSTFICLGLQLSALGLMKLYLYCNEGCPESDHLLVLQPFKTHPGWVRWLTREGCLLPSLTTWLPTQRSRKLTLTSYSLTSTDTHTSTHTIVKYILKANS